MSTVLLCGSCVIPRMEAMEAPEMSLEVTPVIFLLGTTEVRKAVKIPEPKPTINKTAAKAGEKRTWCSHPARSKVQREPRDCSAVSNASWNFMRADASRLGEGSATAVSDITECRLRKASSSCAQLGHLARCCSNS